MSIMEDGGGRRQRCIPIALGQEFNELWYKDEYNTGSFVLFTNLIRFLL